MSERTIGAWDLALRSRVCRRCGKPELTRLRVKPFFCTACRPLRAAERKRANNLKRRPH